MLTEKGKKAVALGVFVTAACFFGTAGRLVAAIIVVCVLLNKGTNRTNNETEES